MSKSILIVDDNEALRNELVDLLEDYNVLEVGTGEGALQILNKANDIGCVVLDVMMPGKSGLEVLGEIKRKNPELSVLILTGHSSKDVAIEALKAKADDYAEKPINIPEFRATIERMMAAAKGEPEISSLDLSGKMAKVKRFIEDNCFKKTQLVDAANSICVSPKYLSRAFKENTGIGFNDYKLKIKIEKSKGLLDSSGHTVEQLAVMLGYENAASFIRQFKKIVGDTPSAFRKKIRAAKTKLSSVKKSANRKRKK